MKQFLLYSLQFIALLLLVLLLTGQLLLGQLSWPLLLMLAVLVLGGLWQLRQLLRGADDNPYYADMVRQKRDWVRLHKHRNKGM
ncbi:MAG TPA: hypothetical protein VIN71_03165 [Pseudomonadales bacterium]